MQNSRFRFFFGFRSVGSYSVGTSTRPKNLNPMSFSPAPQGCPRRWRHREWWQRKLSSFARMPQRRSTRRRPRHPRSMPCGLRSRPATLMSVSTGRRSWSACLARDGLLESKATASSRLRLHLPCFGCTVLDRGVLLCCAKATASNRV